MSLWSVSETGASSSKLIFPWISVVSAVGESVKAEPFRSLIDILAGAVSALAVTVVCFEIGRAHV